MITQAELHQLMEFDPETGIFRFKPRPYTGRKRGWNTTNAGRVVTRLNAKGYVEFRLNTKFYKGHRLAWFYVHGAWPPDQIDHINGIRHDNRIANLRLATNAQNAANRKVQARSRTGVKGVHLHKNGRHFTAYSKVSGRQIFLGNFKTLNEATAARAAVIHKLFGEFARL